MSENFLSLETTAITVDLSTTEILNLLGKEQFPVPVKMGGNVIWFAPDIADWIVANQPVRLDS